MNALAIEMGKLRWISAQTPESSVSSSKSLSLLWLLLYVLLLLLKFFVAVVFVIVFVVGGVGAVVAVVVVVAVYQNTISSLMFPLHFTGGIKFIQFNQPPSPALYGVNVGLIQKLLKISKVL